MSLLHVCGCVPQTSSMTVAVRVRQEEVERLTQQCEDNRQMIDRLSMALDSAYTEIKALKKAQQVLVGQSLPPG